MFFLSRAHWFVLLLVPTVLLPSAVVGSDNPDAAAEPIVNKEEASPSIGAYFVHKTVIIPHDEKKFRGGEDAAATSDTVLVCADGVGG